MDLYIYIYNFFWLTVFFLHSRSFTLFSLLLGIVNSFLVFLFILLFFNLFVRSKLPIYLLFLWCVEEAEAQRSQEVRDLSKYMTRPEEGCGGCALFVLERGMCF